MLVDRKQYQTNRYKKMHKKKNEYQHLRVLQIHPIRKLWKLKVADQLKPIT